MLRVGGRGGSPLALSVSVRQELPDVARLLRRLEASELAGALKNIGEEGVNLARDSFHKSQDPYGHAWPPLTEATLESFFSLPGIPGRVKRRSRGTRPLIRTTALMNSLNYALTPSRTGVLIGASQGYAVYHQGDPTHVDKGIVPRRMFLPSRAKGLPPVWRSAFLERVESFLEGGVA